jgi:hypothetical protein
LISLTNKGIRVGKMWILSAIKGADKNKGKTE